MPKKKTELRVDTASPRVWMGRLVLLYFAGVILYTVLSFALRTGPIVIIDESLYTNIARSLAWEGKLAYRSQPLDYPYILYPLLLVPLFRLQALLGGDIYRWVQAFNVLLICSSVFPVYLLGTDFTGSRKKGFLAAALTLLVADMLMGALEMAEPVIWPLSLWMMVFAWKMITREKTRYGVLTGLFCGLLFFAKPGAVAMGAGFLVYWLIASKNRKPALLGLLTLLGMILLVYAQYSLVFGYDFTLLGLYEKQTSDWETSHLLAVAVGFAEALIAFVMAGGIGAVLIPFFAKSGYRSEQWKMLLATTVGLLAVFLGTAVLVTPYGWEGSFASVPIHLRYAAMYLPMWFVFMLGIETEKAHFAKGFGSTVITALLLIPALGLMLAFTSARFSVIDKMSVGVFSHNSRFSGTVPGVLFVAWMMGFGVWLLLKTRKKITKTVQNGAMIALAVTLLINTCCTAVCISIPTDKGQREDALELNERLAGEESNLLGVTQRHYNDILTYWQEAHMNRPMQQVTMDQMVVSMSEMGGVYQPFVPVLQAPILYCEETPEDPVLVLGQYIGSHVVLSPYIKAETTANGYYTVVTPTPGERWVDSMMYGLEGETLSSDSPAAVYFFVNAHEMTLAVEAPQEGAVLSIADHGNWMEYPVSGEMTLTVPVRETPLEIRTDTTVKITGYTIE